MSYIADYEIVSEIGRGQHGRLYRARPPARLELEEEFVAHKVVAHDADDEEFRRVTAELRIMASVTGPYLVDLHDAGSGGGVLYFAMAFHEDGTLATPSGLLSASQRCRIVADAAHGAHLLHESGVIHRDIKPSNIVLADGAGKLTELGLAHVLAPGRTSTGIGPIGSIAYMEPEIVWGTRASRQSDIWSLGVTLHQTLTGESVYGEIPSGDVLAAFRHVLHNPPVLSSQLPEAFVPVIERALASERTNRYGTAEELAQEIEEAGATQ